MAGLGWCPLLSRQAGEETALFSCTGEECAWWDSDNKCCVVFSINKAIHEISCDGRYDLGDIFNQIST